MKSSKRKGELVFLFLLLFILTLLITQFVMAVRQSKVQPRLSVSHSETNTSAPR